jgi:hypothetical protein
MPDKLWKATERHHNKLLGGSGRTGPQGKNLPDIKHAWLAAESKERRTPIAALEDAMRQAEENAGGKLPIVIWHWAMQNYGDDIVCMRLSAFREWFVGIEEEK